jgi:hypothetical protein
MYRRGEDLGSDPELRATRKLFGPEIGFVEVKNPVHF